jgi:peptidyl-prolyl cis-trans isomerase SurA
MRIFIFTLGVILICGILDSREKDSILRSGVIIARVNEDIITMREVVRRSVILNTSPQNALRTLIEDKALSHQAIKENIKISDNEVEKIFKERLDYFKSLDEFTKSILEPLQMTLGEYRNDLKEQLLCDKYINSKIGLHKLNETTTGLLIDTFVSPKEIKEYFEAHKEKFTRPTRIKTRQIILKISEIKPLFKAKELAEKILERLQKGESFETLAREYSDIKAETGGLWDWAEKGTFLPEIEKLIYALNPNEISPIITTVNALFIIKIEEKFIDSPLSASPEIQDEIRKFLANQKIIRGTQILKENIFKQSVIYIEKEFITALGQD